MRAFVSVVACLWWMVLGCTPGVVLDGEGFEGEGEGSTAEGEGDTGAEGEGDTGAEGEGDTGAEGEGDTDEPPLADIALSASVTRVQPMTGIVLWEDNESSMKTQNGVIQLEYAYTKFSDIAVAEGSYDWSDFDDFLDRIAGREHQAVVRFYDTYPGAETAVPDWIKARPDYQETIGSSEGLTTSFPDWSSPVLEQFTLDFYEAFAARYDNDARIAFVQAGFGLWGEYHIYDGPNAIGEQFPSHEYQARFHNHLSTVLQVLPWSISIDAGDDYYGPFTDDTSDDAALLALDFGLFDDSFMHEEHSGYNATMWNVFGHEQRLARAPAGGELSYYTDFDQEHALDAAGMYGRTYEELSAQYGISYMIGNDQPQYQSAARVRAAGMSNGYRFRITRYAANDHRSEVEVENVGIAPMYFDAFVSVDGVRAEESLRSLMPGERATFRVARAGTASSLSIACDHLVAGQRIDFDADLP
jgi:hypothetical protein